MHRILSVLAAGIMLAGCAGRTSPIHEGRSGDPQKIQDKTWQWESTITPVEKIAVPAPERYTVILRSDGKAEIRFDCNRGGGKYTVSEGKLSFGPLISTRMACPPDSMDGLFMRDLQRVVSFFVDDGVLYLEMPHDSGTLKFRPEEQR